MTSKGFHACDLTPNKAYARRWYRVPTVTVTVGSVWVCNMCGSVAFVDIYAAPLFGTRKYPDLVKSRNGEYSNNSVDSIRWN